jgi:hypothetical protein
LILYGGSPGGTFHSDTWVFDGSRWILWTFIGPGQRSEHGMAFDTARGVAVMFGGAIDPTTPVDDTWEFDGLRWTQRSVLGPARRRGHGMVYDSARGHTVLFGGGNGSGNLSDTWLFDGVVWVRAPVSTSPRPRLRAAMAYDAGRARVVLFGGVDNTTYLSDTWEWDGAQWTFRFVWRPPAARFAAGMSYDSSRRRTVLFGGSGLDANGRFIEYSDTWEWDGATWTERQPVGPVPSARMAHVMAYHDASGRSIVFGGVRTGVGNLNDTWQYGPQFPASLVSYGASCAGTAGLPQLALAPGQLPWLGDTLDLRLTSLPAAPGPGLLYVGFSSTQWGAIPLPLVLTSIGMTGCALLTSPDVSLPFAHAGGTATVQLAIPNDPANLGLSFFDQVVLLDLGANPLGLTATGGLAGRIGGR